MNLDHSDSDSGSIFTVKTNTTAPTEWTSEERHEPRDGSDVMSILSSLYVCNFDFLDLPEGPIAKIWRLIMAYRYGGEST